MSGVKTTIRLPVSLRSEEPEPLFRLCEQMRAAPGDIVLDAEDFVFIDPLGIAVLGALWPSLRSKTVSIVWLDTDLEIYLARMNFFHHCEVEGFSSEPNGPEARRVNSIELTCISEEHLVDATAERLAEAITRCLTPARPDAPIDEFTGKNAFMRFSHPLQYALTELLLNALTHAKREGFFHAAVWVAAQVNKAEKTLKFSVVDNGCGMLGSLRKHSRLEFQKHEAAIKLALEPTVSCNRDGVGDNENGNEGVGLTTTSRIAEAARGYLLVTSGDATVRTNDLQTFAPMADGASWHGVAISFQCLRKHLKKVDISTLFPDEEGVDEVAIDFA